MNATLLLYVQAFFLKCSHSSSLPINRCLRAYDIAGATIEISPSEQQKEGGSKGKRLALQWSQLGAVGRIIDWVGILSRRANLEGGCWRLVPGKILTLR